MNPMLRLGVVGPSLLVLVLVLSTAGSGQPPQQTQAQPPGRPPHGAASFPGAALFNSHPPFLACVAVNHADCVYQEGEKLVVKFVAERDSHLYLMYHQVDGQSVLLFPNEAHPENRLPAYQPVVIPPPGGQPFRFRVRPPLGAEVLQVLASLKPLEELDGLVEKTGRAPAVSPEMIARLGARLAGDPSSWTEHRVAIRTVPKAPEPPPRKAARVGLFIGIGRYLHPEFAHTHEELRRSAERMHELMLKQGGLDPQRTKLVLDEQATKANLEELIARWLPSVSQPGDTVFIYFSGHAGQVPNLDHTEADGQDEVLGPYDLEGGHPNESRATALARFRRTNIVDDTLARWIEALQGRQVVLILDTCHSGGVVEGKDLGRSFFTDEADRVKDIAQLNTLILTSCGADEQTLFEGMPNKTMWFTFCLTEAIERTDRPRPLSVQKAFEYSRDRLKQLLVAGNAARAQEPTMTDNVLLPILLAP